MTYRTLISRISLPIIGLLLPTLMAAQVQAPVRALITKPVDESKLVAVQAHVSPLLQGAKDLGAVDAAQPAGRMLLVLKRSDEQEASLQQFLEQVHESNSPNFHKWLKPADFAARYGAADSDVAQLTTWLGQHGLSVAKVSAGKTSIEFSGSIGNVNEAFHTSIHSYNVNGVTHHANATVAQVPAAFSDIVAGVSQLNDFKPVAQSKVMGRAAYNPTTHAAKPQWTYSNGSGNLPYYFLGPEDFSKQYDIAPVYSAGLTGAGQTIGIINDSNIDISLVNAYRKIFGLPVNPPQVVVDGYDPGINGDAVEAYLDVENAGAVAPNATIKLYTAGGYGLFGGGGIVFSLYRAVDDDAASVLSLSFGECELGTGTFANVIYEQAAAQGQTVLVAAGDSGSYDGCNGLGVNGLGSTPWNIAVGGTDIYLSDYATGGASVANYWGTSNDGSFGSLQKAFPEQPWDSTMYGLNISSYVPAGFIIESGAGGGGASSCINSSYNSSTYTYTCLQGWAKPSWQVGPGVPNDKVRDLPDVSLFAADGINGVSWPICASAGDCSVVDPSLGELEVTAVGGTSASTPAMAGIMALINQKYGPQGQANNVLYPLAAQFPSVFHDVTVGSNNIPCIVYYLGCSLDPNANGSLNYSYQKYSAGAGYDQASGLGSIDVNALVTNWNKITFQTSATQLTLTPTTLTHGQNITATATVTGKGTPTGSVALISSSTLPANTGQYDLALNSQGVGTASFNSLPGGTYTIYGQYSGDGVNAASKSAPITITVNPEPSVAILSGQYYNTTTAAVSTITQGSSIQYDTAAVLDVQIAGTANTLDGAATGTVVFMDGKTVLATVPLSATGVAEYVAYGMATGSHSITVSYAGDPSYLASTSTALNFTITPQQSKTEIWVDRNDAGFNQANSSVEYLVGQTVTMVGLVVTQGAEVALPPTGTMTFQLGNGTPVVQPIVHENFLTYGFTSLTGGAAVNYPSLPAGTQKITVTYSGDANYAPSVSSGYIQVVASPLLPTSVKVALVSPSDPSTITPNTLVTMKATITGSGTTAPTGKMNIFEANVQFISADNFTGNNVVPGTGNTSTATFTFLAGDLQPENNLLIFTYGGDKTYQGSSSAAITIPDSDGDFSLLLTTPNVAILSGKSGTANLQIGSTNGYAGAVALTCTAPSGLTCTVSTGSVTLASGGSTTATVTINAAVTTGSVRYGWRIGGGGVVLAGLMLLFLPRRRKLLPLVCCLLSFAVIAGTVGCGGSSGAASGGGHVTTNAKAGTYTVLVTGTSLTGVVHDATVTVIVQ
jgi:hypothetical protein